MLLKRQDFKKVQLEYRVKMRYYSKLNDVSGKSYFNTYII